MYDRREAEGTKRRHQVDTVVEGMWVSISFPKSGALKQYLSGINRMTNNIELALPVIDDAFRY